MKSKLPLIMAAIIGVLALLAVKSYVNRMQEQAQAQLKGDPYVAARVDIPKGVDITLDMLTPKSVPKPFASTQAIKGEEVKLLLGRKARFGIQAGQVMSWSDIEPEKTEGLSGIIPDGQRAFTVSISRGLKPAMLQPGDHIDILGSFAAPKPNQPMPNNMSTWRQSSDMVNMVLLQNVTVLALGDSLNAPGTGSTDLTLALTLQEAQLLMFASEHGELGAVLRKWESPAVLPRDALKRVTFQDVEQLMGDLDNQRNYRTVEIQRGGSTTPVPVTNTNL